MINFLCRGSLIYLSWSSSHCTELSVVIDEKVKRCNIYFPNIMISSDWIEDDLVLKSTSMYCTYLNKLHLVQRIPPLFVTLAVQYTSSCLNNFCYLLFKISLLLTYRKSSIFSTGTIYKCAYRFPCTVWTKFQQKTLKHRTED